MSSGYEYSHLSHWFQLYNKCKLCPRECGVNRLSHLKKGLCGCDWRLKIAYIGPHFGEEPCISGSRGSGTIFFSGCSLGCIYCQNYQISKEQLGNFIDPLDFVDKIVKLIKQGIHNLNFVTPDHFIPHILYLFDELKSRKVELPPIIWNLSGYQKVESLKLINDIADIYLVDFKYGDPSCAKKYSKANDYINIALSAINRMFMAKGPLKIGGSGIAQQGVLVRHLILPGNINNSVKALEMLFIEFGPDLPLSIMSQYYPSPYVRDISLLKRLTQEEFSKILDYALKLGFTHIYFQWPQEEETPSSFWPDFKKREPFGREV